MKDQVENIRKELIAAIRNEVTSLEKSMTRTKVAEKAGVRLSFLSNFMGLNQEGMNGLAIPKLIQMANGLGLDVELIIKKKSSK